MDWVGDCTDRKSISGLTVLLDRGTISWGSKKQSTVKAEFIAASTVKEVLWYQALFRSLDMPLTYATRVLIANQGASDLIKSGHINDRIKHIDIKY